MHLRHKDVWLGSFADKQAQVTKLMSGNQLLPDANGCQNSAGQNVLTFSKKFKTQIEDLSKRGYALKRAKVNFVVYWYNEDLKKEFAVVLPELQFERNG